MSAEEHTTPIEFEYAPESSPEKLICPVCFEAGIDSAELPSHICAGHGIEMTRARILTQQADVDPIMWLGTLREVEDNLAWVLARLDSTESGVSRESLLLAAAVLERRRMGLLQTGHTGCLVNVSPNEQPARCDGRGASGPDRKERPAGASGVLPREHCPRSPQEEE